MKEISDVGGFEDWLHTKDRAPCALQALDLLQYAAQLRATEFPGSLFLGCDMQNDVVGHLIATGSHVLPEFKEFEFELHRSTLYDAAELFDGFDPSDPCGYIKSKDYKIYKEYVAQGAHEPASIKVALAQRLHDHSITDALFEAIGGRKVIAVMGGHAMERANPFYAKIATLSQKLTSEGFLLVSGGGPGAMEAANLGAYFAMHGSDELRKAIEMLKRRPADAKPGKEYSDKDWLHRAWSVLQSFPLDESHKAQSMSIGIPTWFYGHEPPSPFATHIAKYFANSVREDGLLMIARHGVIFAPGSAGTTQEIFQDAAQNHYGTAGYFSPMICFGVEHWTVKQPAWPLLETISRNHMYGELLLLTDSEDAILRKLRSYDPEMYKKQEN
jgi:predicted Rossmann-fold nucleotide-binding protein